MAAGRVKTTWNEETAPKKQKGTLNKKTRLKKALGISNWSELQNFIETTGIKKYVDELNKLDGKDFATAFTSITEFVKPKLARSEVLADVKTDITWSITKTYDSDKKTDSGT